MALNPWVESRAESVTCTRAEGPNLIRARVAAGSCLRAAEPLPRLIERTQLGGVKAEDHSVRMGKVSPAREPRVQLDAALAREIDTRRLVIAHDVLDRPVRMALRPFQGLLSFPGVGLPAKRAGKL